MRQCDVARTIHRFITNAIVDGDEDALATNGNVIRSVETDAGMGGFLDQERPGIIVELLGSQRRFHIVVSEETRATDSPTPQTDIRPHA